MKLTFVGHASVLFEVGGVSLLIDPWLKGEAFNDSWALYPQAVLHEDDLARVTHIWISHEHPDHLSIPTLESISPEIRARITVLIQERHDTETLDWLQGQGFKEVVEMPHAEWLALDGPFKVACHQIGHTDSALAIKTPNFTVLNLNDCDTPVSTLKRILEGLGFVDLLLNQFSIAGWPGNPSEVERKRDAARRVLGNFLRDFEQISPRYILPFASFVRFSHRENCHMNSDVNSVDDVAAKVDSNKLVVMYPGDEWETNDGAFAGTARAIESYRRDALQLESQALNEHESVEFGEILSAASSRVAEFHANYQSLALRFIPRVTFYLTDLGRAMRVDVRSGAEEVDLPEEECVVSLSSQAALYSFTMRFGLPTLGVSGRFRINHSGQSFARLKKLGSACSAGFYTKKAPRFGFTWRLFRFWWRRRRDVISQFATRIA